jgi:hypothetical protein
MIITGNLIGVCQTLEMAGMKSSLLTKRLEIGDETTLGPQACQGEAGVVVWELPQVIAPTLTRT